MLNELHDLAKSLQSLQVSLVSWHMHFKTCPKGAATYFGLLDASGQLLDLEQISDRNRLASIRKWEVAAGVSFPAFNVLPLFKPRTDEARQAAVELRKSITSRTPPSPDEVRQRVLSLIESVNSLWLDKESARITKSLTTLAGEVGRSLGSLPDEFRSIGELIIRAGKLEPLESLHSQLSAVLVRKIGLSSNMAAGWFDALFFHSGKSPKKWSLIVELGDRSAFPHPANDQRVQAWMNSRFSCLMNPFHRHRDKASTASDAFAKPVIKLDQRFPSVRLPVLGNVILRIHVERITLPTAIRKGQFPVVPSRRD